MFIHAIWAGGEAPLWAIEGLKEIASAWNSPDHTLLFWYFPKPGAPGQNTLPPPWREVSARTTPTLLTENWKLTSSAADLEKVVEAELYFENYSAIKDLMSFVVLSCLGGLYLDVSVKKASFLTFCHPFGSDVKSSNPKDWQPIMIPRITEKAVFARPPRTHSPSNFLSIETFPDVGEARTRARPTDFFLPHFDVWAVFAKEADAAAAAIMTSAADFMMSNYAEIYSGTAAIDWSSKPLTSPSPSAGLKNRFTKLYGTSDTERDIAKRNIAADIGGSVICALIDAFVARGHSMACSMTNIADTLKCDSVWRTSNETKSAVGSPRTYYIPSLKLLKIHKNSWR